MTGINKLTNPLNALTANSSQGDSASPDKYWALPSSGVNKLGNILVDGLFFNWMNLEAGDAWRVYPYQFEVHDGEKPLKTLTMPLGPQSISINVPTAVTTTVTMRGLTEEHNDAPLRQIVITGTTGITPDSSQTIASSGPSSLLEYAFANTIQSFNRSRTTFEKTATAFMDAKTGAGRQLNSPLVSTDDLVNPNIDTAYTAIHNMSRFFDQYLAAKKQGASKMFLSFYMHKDQMYYDCTLNNYSIRKIAGSMEYQYTITLTAWRRRDRPVGERPPRVRRQSASEDSLANIFAAINNLLSGIIKGMNELAGVLKGFSRDFETVVLGPIKKVGLLIKTLANIGLTIADFPNAIAQLSRNAIKSAFKDMMQKNQNTEALESLNKKLKSKKNLNSPSPVSQPNSYNSNVIPNTVSLDEAGTKADDPGTTQEISDPFDAIFRDPQEFADVFEFFTVDELNISNELQALIDAEIEKALALTSSDVTAIRESFEIFISNYSEVVGGGSATYNRINGKGEVKQVTKSLSVEDITVLSLFNDGMQALDDTIVLLQNRESASTAGEDYAAYFAEQARSYGIDFADNVSKFYVPFEYGSSLERMAVKYLGQDSRWIEIAAINALKAPYVDEEGTYRYFTFSGAGNSFSIADSSDMYVGQVIEISSDVERPEPRTVTGIDVVSSVESIITVKGEGDLARFSLAHNAKIKTFLPNTVNSNQLIAIPSSIPVNIPGNIRLNPDREDLTFITLTAKADFLLNFNKQNSADLAFTGADIKIARGMTNLIQAATIKILTKQGDLLDDPTFGNSIEVGANTADINPADILRQLSQMYQADPRFQNIRAGRVTKSSNTLLVDLVLSIQNSQAYLPFTAAIPIGVS